MKRRTFLSGILGASLLPFTVDATATLGRLLLVGSGVPKVEFVEGGWPQGQYGSFIWHDEPRPEAELKVILGDQAREMFAAMQVPDASEKIEYLLNLGPTTDLTDTYASGWKVTIPVPAWQLVLNKHSEQGKYLKSVLRTRQRHISIALNGHTQLIPRSTVLHYLRAVTNA